MNLEAEFKRISRLIKDKATQINSEATAKGVFYSGMPIVKRIEGTSQILEDEIGKLIPDFSSKRYLLRINEFVDEQSQLIYKSAKVHGLAGGSTLVELDSRVQEIKATTSNRRLLNVKRNRKELIRFWIPVVISLAALIMSILSLLQSSGAK